MKKQHGFTLLELMITVGIIAIMAAIALPNMNAFIANTRTVNRAEQIANLFRLSQGEAIRMNVPVIICGTNMRADGRPEGTCNANQISTGLMAYADLNKNGEYNNGTDTIVRAITLNADSSNKQVNITTDACDLTSTSCGKKISTQQFIFMPNGLFGYLTSATSSRSALMSGANTSLGANYIRFMVEPAKGKNNLARTRIVVMTPTGAASICASGETYSGSNTSNNKICAAS